MTIDPRGKASVAEHASMHTSRTAAHLGGREATGATGGLLDVEGGATAAGAQSVRMLAALALRRSTLGLRTTAKQ